MPYVLDRRPSPEFSYEAGKNKLINLRISSDNGPRISIIIAGDPEAADLYSGQEGLVSAGRQAKLLRLSGWIDVESRVTVCIKVQLT